MRKFASHALFAVLPALLFVGSGISQETEEVRAAAGSLYVVSAKAGGVNHVEGNVSVDRQDGRSGRLLKGEFVEVGERVVTGENGRAEVLMNPGSFIRLDGASEFAFETTTLDDLRVNFYRGTAIFEVFASDDFTVRINAAGSRFYLIKSGVYRIDLDETGSPRLEVWKGKAQAGDMSATTIKKGRAATMTDGAVTVSKFRKNMDEFEEWSKDRAKQIAKANRALAARKLGRTVLSSYRNYSWNCYDSLGLWVFNRRFASYSFLPFGYGWKSPYGFRLGSSTSICNYPAYYWRRPLVPYRRGGKGGNGGGKKGDGGNPTDRGDRPPIENPRSRIDRGSPPPFRTLEKTRSVRRIRRIGPLGGSRSYPSPAGKRTGNSSTPRATKTVSKPVRATKSQIN